MSDYSDDSYEFDDFEDPSPRPAATTQQQQSAAASSTPAAAATETPPPAERRPYDTDSEEEIASSRPAAAQKPQAGSSQPPADESKQGKASPSPAVAYGGAARNKKNSSPPPPVPPVPVKQYKARQQVHPPPKPRPAYPPEQQAIVEELKKSNTELRYHLMELNRQLDEQLNQRGQKVSRIQNKSDTSVIDKMITKNEMLRKQNHELEDRLRAADSMVRCAELQNLVVERTKEAAALREENRSLENVYANQMVKIQQSEKVEGEMRRMRSAHSEEVRQMKEKMKQLKEAKENDHKSAKHAQRKLDKLEGKLKAQDAIESGTTVEELEDRMKEKNAIIDTLKYQVAVLSKTNANEKRKVNQKSKKVAKELADLREEVVLLRERNVSQSMAGELGVRM